ncbi:hypothetical protein B0E33_20825 [Roseibium algicola]|jgi:hypothetical protein|uniref:Uncharacterized protein n=1 Tax=Roseibium algicola TaxID=2857014 RepID=A0ABM6I5L7_9HYPH|nr:MULTISPECIES: hypothetical protein [Stappiaceae]MCR9280811.1 hypothetical protein [Paracoccaceae bacterium]MEC9418234.1 hypothetical protein [Pseudomonadota bacterium]AQQ05708.1 hypothetical protein B0E33_20825 [Roseibium aggregatum]NKI57329.1 hypothetical protein [Labrenzia sp. PO1]UES49948.1 hypothetical protein GFK88_10160 [Roseibium aggregatum]
MKALAKTAAAASVLAIAGVASLGAVTPAAALFDICKKVNITVKNNTGQPIQLYDLDYRDLGSNRWRSENISNRVIAHGGTYKVTRNLEGVNNASTFVRVQFRKLKSNGRWNLLKTWYADSSTSVCRKGASYRIVFR